MFRLLSLKLFGILLVTNSLSVIAADNVSEDVVAKTANGDEVVLHANGYWEYVDADKSAIAKKKVEAIAREEGCPRGTRASFFGIGRCIPNDDPSLKKGSLSGKGW